MVELAFYWEIEMQGSAKKFGIILTAGHVVCNPVSSLQSEKYYNPSIHHKYK